MSETRTSAARERQAARVRAWRHRAGHTRSTLVDLAALGRALGTLTEDQLAAFTAEVGEDVTRRALAAARPSDTPELVRSVAL